MFIFCCRFFQCQGFVFLYLCITSHVSAFSAVASYIASAFVLLSVLHHELHVLVIVYGCVLALLGANPTQAGRVPLCLFTGIWAGGSTN